MKALIIIKEQDYSWIREVLPHVHPLLVPICNKPFAEFLIDFSILAGCEAIRFASDGPLSDVEHYCDDGSRWGIAVSYSSIQSADELQQVIKKNQRYCSDGKIIVISGFIFIHYNKQKDYKKLFAALPEGEILNCNCGSLSLSGAPLDGQKAIVSDVALSLTGLNSIDVYYRLSMEVLGYASSPYVLPGYSNEAYCSIGSNVVITKGAEIIKPVIIGNNVQILAGSVIGPDAVIGNNVIVDRDSTVSASIVMDNTYIGEHLAVTNRIATENILIEPECGASMAMEDPHLLTGIKKIGSAETIVQSLVHGLMALILISLQLIPFLLLLPILTMQGKWKWYKNTSYTTVSGKTLKLTTATLERNGLISTLAGALSLDRLPLLFRVLSGQLAIIGGGAVVANSNTVADLSSAPSSNRACVFSYAEAEDWPLTGGDSAIVERYYAVHGNPFQDIIMTVKALFNRILEKNTP